MSKKHVCKFPEPLPFQVPIEYYADEHGRHIIVDGARRFEALKALAAAGEPGFAADMPILATEVSKPTTKD